MNLLNECFDTENEYFHKMLQVFKEEQIPPLNKHHIIPRSFYKKKGIKVDNSKSNLIALSIKNHLLVHFYAFKCAKPFIKKEMAAATKWIFSSLNKTEEEIKEVLDEYAIIREEVEKSARIWNKENSKKVVCLDTQKIYDTIHDAEKDTGCDYRLISKVVNGERLAANNLHFEFAEKDFYTAEECKEKIKEIENNRQGFCGQRKQVICVETGKIYENGRQAALKNNIKYTTLNRALNLGLKTNNLTFKYVNEENNNTIKNPPKNAKKIICIETGEIYNSLTEASKMLNCSGFSRAINKGYAVKGKHFKYL